ncbi:MAG TPA: TetR/AcrR family transcriptional regulator [Sedimentibacter sp.]|jgi:AcrR family transcriptional regulator|nr:TetR/AcrR family transcriptional regulator [Sedimentibacter sp.]NLA14614.1 TetR/AcrR family transcriptional regulator [Tissierellia bacterium]HPB78607.1 TetR/AcrR family transcriptional regulator [Sedimentibacter sp.]HQK52756.1 TetR/AcrR family transcriptional regulator [Sedimentibacter sp.]HQO71699.1 TetR/AcrR family transcriptional regulator [Sedimentibacter sp.]
MELVNEPKTKRGMETLDRICIAAEELFSEKGYYDTGITDIVTRAGIAQGTFYIYFNDKKSVFVYLIRKLGSELKESIRANIRVSKDRYDEEYMGIKTFLNFVGEHIGLFKIVWQAQFVDPELFKEYYESFSKGYVKNIKKAQTKGEMNDIDPVILSYCLIGIANFTALKFIEFDNKNNYEEVVEEVMKFIKNGAFV